jgi:apolipoprotein N-acyltransferase
MTGERPGLKAVAALGLVAGLAVALSLPPFGFYPLAWAGLALVAWLLVGMRWRRRAWLGWWFGLAQFGVGEAWVREFNTVGYTVLVLISSLFWLAALALVPSGTPARVAWGLPAVTLVAEWFRDRFPLGGFPMSSIALGQVAGPLKWTLRIGGSVALCGETALVGVAVAGVISWVASRGHWPSAGGAQSPALARRHRSLFKGTPPRLPGRPHASRTLALGAIAAAAFVALAGWITPSGAAPAGQDLQVALVQGGGPRGTRAIFTDPKMVFARHARLFSTLRRPLSLVVLPEGVLQSSGPYQDGSEAVELAALARRLGATVMAGVVQDVPPNRYLNEVVAWGPRGAVVAVYVKNHLVPFGEYIPWRSFISRYFNVSAVPYDGIAGHSPALAVTPAGRLGVLISYEVFFDRRALSAVRHGASVLVVPTNTASYRSTQVPTQELAASRMRAIETGRWLVQVAETGYSAVVSPSGTVTERSQLGAPAVIYASVPKLHGSTFFDDVGQRPLLYACVLILVLNWVVEGSRFSRLLRGVRSRTRPGGSAHGQELHSKSPTRLRYRVQLDPEGTIASTPHW